MLLEILQSDVAISARRIVEEFALDHLCFGFCLNKVKL